MITALLLGLVTSVAGPDAQWKAPSLYIDGQPFQVHVVLKSAEPVPAWMLEPAAFTIDGQPIGDRKAADPVAIDTGVREFDADLAPLLADHPAAKNASFVLGYGEGGKTTTVSVGKVADKSTAFMDDKAVPTADLGSYRVLLKTSAGPLVVEFWPDVAPNHVRNFLDLSATGFYDGIAFHRVKEGFMAQCGDPNTKTTDRKTWGMGGSPRKIKREFNNKKHVRGVLSAARSSDPDSASSQFFLMDASNPGLDGAYSAFGKLTDGFETLDKIVRSPGLAGPDGTIQPTDPPRIQHATIVKLVPSKAVDAKAETKPESKPETTDPK